MLFSRTFSTKSWCAGLVTACLLNYAALASAADLAQLSFVTLGTAGGPEADPSRAQPANAVVYGQQIYLVDAGDGAAGQLKKAGFRIPDVSGLFISHNHFDHTGGLMAILGLRMQLNAHNTFTIWGPKGTKALVAGLLDGMSGPMQAAYGMPGQQWQPFVEVKELQHGDEVELGDLSVKVARNSHFAIPQNAGQHEKASSLAFRFDTPQRSVVYTGDTGPSKEVEALAKGADLLVSEMMDIPAVLTFIKQVQPNIPAKQLAGIEWHFRAHHLLPEQVAEMASNAGVKAVVVTHMVPAINNNKMAAHYGAKVAEGYAGKVTFASDLDTF